MTGDKGRFYVDTLAQSGMVDWSAAWCGCRNKAMREPTDASEPDTQAQHRRGEARPAQSFAITTPVIAR